MNEIEKAKSLEHAFIKQIAFEVDDGFTASLPQAIVANFDEVKTFITEQTENDRNVIVTPDNIEYFKQRRAMLNKQRDAVNTQKIEIHKLWDAPYKNFEDKCKELLAVFDSAIGNIDGQLKMFDNAEREEKRREFEEYYNEKGSLVKNYKTYWHIEDAKWLNKSVKKETVFAAIDKIIEDISRDVEAIKALKSPSEFWLIKMYKDGADVRDIIAAGINAAPYDTPDAPTAPKEKEETKDREPDINVDGEITITVTLTGTKEQFKKLKAFLYETGIKYGREE